MRGIERLPAKARYTLKAHATVTTANNLTSVPAKEIRNPLKHEHKSALHSGRLVLGVYQTAV
jgi:hypothetical protein